MNIRFTMEMKAVNHRYLDLSIKMPKKFNYFEAVAMASSRNTFSGKDRMSFISYEDYTDEKVLKAWQSFLPASILEDGGRAWDSE